MPTGWHHGRETVSMRLLAALWLFVSAALIWSGWTQITTLSGWDPDDALRLVQLRDFLNGQSWFDTTQYRMNPPDGAPMHWSRLIELPLAALVVLSRPLLGQSGAEMLAGTAVPLLLLCWIAYMLSSIATRIASREAGVAAALIALSSGALLLQLRPMRIDHHGWQLAMAVLALLTMFWGDVRRAGLVLGLALAVWLHISLEGAPMAAAFFVLLGFRWVRDGGQDVRLWWTIIAFVGVSLALFFGTQRLGLFAPVWCDTISPPHIDAILIGTVVMLPAIRLLPDDWRLRLLAGAVAGGGALTAIVFLAPHCLGGAFGEMDPLVRQYWYSKITEGLPVWHQPWQTALSLGAGLIAGVASWFILRTRLGPKDRQRLDTIGYFLFCGLILSVLVVRTVSVATAYAIPAAAALIAHLFENYRLSKRPLVRVLLVATMLVLLVPGTVTSTLVRAITAGSEAKSEKAKISNDQCQSAPSVAALGALPKGKVVAPFDMGPAVLAHTAHSVLASSHHRNEHAMRDHIQIFRLPPDLARAQLAARQIDYLALCPGETELAYYARTDPEGLWAQIKGGNIPEWLRPLPDMGKGIRVWRVDQR